MGNKARKTQTLSKSPQTPQTPQTPQRPPEWVRVQAWDKCPNCMDPDIPDCDQCVIHKKRESEKYEQFKKVAKDILSQVKN